MHLKTETTVGIFVLGAIFAFLFMSFQIGFFRFDQSQYVPYDSYFVDASGLTRRSDVKIAGVRVGWVDSVVLDHETTLVKLTLMVSSKYILSEDSQAIIRQDGVLGFKFVEIIPGTSQKVLSSGNTLQSRKLSSPTVDDVLAAFSRIMNDIQSISSSLKEACGSCDVNESVVKEAFITCKIAAQNMLETSEKIKDFVRKNEDTASSIFYEVKKIVERLDEKMPLLGSRIEEITNKLTFDYLPKITKDFNKISRNLSDSTAMVNQNFIPQMRDYASKLTKSVELASDSLKNAADEIHDLTKKINSGESFLSKLSNNTDIHGIRRTLDNMCFYVEKLGSTTFGLDNYYEFLGSVNNFKENHDFKTHVNLWVHPTDYFFFLGGLSFSKNGFIKKKTFNLVSNDCSVNEVFVTERKKNVSSFNLQAGGYYKNFALRFGIFESTPGLALDCLFPLNDTFKLISTFELFDFTGKHKLSFDKKPHLKWINRLYCTPTFYFSFGIDDFASRKSVGGFLGFGLNFGDTYFLIY